MMDPAFEIRKLMPSQVNELVKCLETHELWKELMAIIPKDLGSLEYTCDISITNPHKYNSEHFRIIENASMKTKQFCTKILLDEWGTSGRVLPTVGHLLHLLTKAKLFRAAEYVAESLLNQPKPQRPDHGPEALIPINLPSPKASNETKVDIEKNDPTSTIEQIFLNNSRSVPKSTPPVIPKIIVPPHDNDDNTAPSSSVPVVKHKKDNSESNMIEFSSDSKKSEAVSNSKVKSKDIINGNTNEGYSCSINESTRAEVPEMSALHSENTQNLPDFSLIDDSQVLSSKYSIENPALSELFINESTQAEVPEVSALHSEDRQNLPDFSLIDESQALSSKYSIENPALSELSINESTQAEVPEVSALHSEDRQNLPDFSLIDDSQALSSKYSIENPSLSERNPQTSHENIPLSALGDAGTANGNLCAVQSKNIISNENLSNTLYSPILSALDRTNEVSVLGLVDLQRSNSFSSNDLSALSVPKSKSLLKERSMNESNSSIESLTGNENKHKSNSIHLSSSDTNSRPGNSPLPQLSLNTQLPHFNYSDLMKATNDFNTDLYIDEVASGRFLGSGAFGSVFLAFDLMDKPVAVKKLVLENVDYVDIDARVTKQFKNEVEILSRYNHPNLLPLVGYSCDGCTYCLLYEYVQGGALNVRLQAQTNKLQWKQRLKIAVGTANAIAYLHTADPTPLVHRDIKSANILLDCTYTPKLCDFGLIKLSPSQNTSTATTVIGTSAYMAPEAFRGKISVKMDTFSFGVVLLELLTSLSPVDENREETDLISHVGESCGESSISPLLDREAGSWTEDEVNYAEEVYKIALMCLEEKKKRPNMVTVRDLLSDLTKPFFG